MNHSKNLIEPKLHMNPTKNLIGNELFFRTRSDLAELIGQLEKQIEGGGEVKEEPLSSNSQYLYLMSYHCLYNTYL